MQPKTPLLTVDVIVRVHEGVVLVERKHPPHGWALPGGFVDYGEEPVQAARREVLEETGLKAEITGLLGVYGHPERDPRQHTVSVVYTGRAEGTPHGGDDARRARVCSLNELPALCFDHAQILEDYVRLHEPPSLEAPAVVPVGGHVDPDGLLTSELLVEVSTPSVLLDIARDAAESAVCGRPPRLLPAESSPRLRALRATFVTVRTTDGALRGCIGELTAQRSLSESVRWTASRAVVADPRFPPVRPEEFGELRFSVSVLSPAVPVASPADVQVGRHGVTIEAGESRGVLLPEIALQQGWSAEEFVAAVCRKAGLSADAWRATEAVLAVFETEHFGEREEHRPTLRAPAG